jgi:hypothetical protein
MARGPSDGYGQTPAGHGEAQPAGPTSQARAAAPAAGPGAAESRSDPSDSGTSPARASRPVGWAHPSLEPGSKKETKVEPGLTRELVRNVPSAVIACLR